MLKHHYLGKGDTIVNINECLTWLTNGVLDSFDQPDANGDKVAQLKEALMNNRLIGDITDDLRHQFAECADNEVDMLNRSTWQDTPYSFKRADRH